MRQRAAPSSATSATSAAVSRRRLLKRGLLGALVLGAAGAALVRTRGYSVGTERTLRVLTPWQFVVVEHAARRLCAPDRPDDASIPTSDALDVAGFADAQLASMPLRVQRDLGRMLAYLEHGAPIAAGFGSRFTRLGPAEQDTVLGSLAASHSDLLRAGLDGLKSLVFMGYYRDPRAWAIAGYDGPLLDRPSGGWR